MISFLARGSTADSVFQLFVALLIFVFVIALTYFTTRWIANYQKNQMVAGNLHIIETMRLSPNKVLAIVEAGGEYFLVGLGKDEISYIGKLDPDRVVIPSEDGRTGQFGSFKDIFMTQLKKSRQSDE